MTLNAEQFWHGSDTEFEVGDTLLPQSVTGNVNFVVAPERATSVYVTNRRAAARPWGKNVYEVRPGELRPDDRLKGGHAWRTPSAEVLSTPKSRAKAARSMP